MDTSHYIGIDISCKTFDAAIFSDSKNLAHKKFSNDLAGFEALLTWLDQPDQALHITMEATNVYWEPLAYFLTSKNIQVSVVNPKRIKGYANSMNIRNKTDKIDAKIIARFCAKEHPETWQAPDQDYRELLLTLRQLQHLKQSLQAEKTRLTMIKGGGAIASCQRTIAFLISEINDVKVLIKQLVAKNATMASNAKLLHSIPAVGQETIPWLLAYLGDGSRFKKAKQATCFAGLTPMLHQSGTSVEGRPRISKIGHAEIRKVLFMPALVGSFGRGKDGIYSGFVQRLLQAGKAKPVIITALMRKLLSIAQGVLKSQKPFDMTLHL